ncbi:MAG: hypothetical protein HQL12_04325 [Candidatus Omnitrophica bacterium]|nr:hypothetical protein [Candidatus Omnitrophota bacterium]
MRTKAIYGFLIVLTIAATPVFAQAQLSSNDIIVKMKTDLDLQDDQVTNITPIIEKYTVAFYDLQKSIEDGSINQSSIDSQRQGLQAAETQELSQYLKPDQLSLWRGMQNQMDKQKDKDNGNGDLDQYSNLPRDISS